ncbi:radial spoke head 1 homolog [Hetaerina americana]|uniref:radial spoke head 1 homolog n=1 Tax=Hetaerina americana TaxID=62018 RepID=UPI003A7F3A4A
MDEDIVDEEFGEEDDKIGEYEGRRNEINERHGLGRAILPNKDLYQGYYRYGRRDGNGLYMFRNGARYDGDWYQNLKDGNGIFYYPDGSKYEGQWQSDMKHGYGAYTYPNGDFYEGTWKENFRHGLGTYLFKATETKFLGTWVNGIREGPGQLLHPKNRFYGTWVKDMPLGPGCYVFDPPVDCMIHGEYIHVKDPAFESIGKLEEGDQDEPQAKIGLIPVWRSDRITEFDPTLLPPIPVPTQIPEIRIKKSIFERDSELVQRIVDFENITNDCLETKEGEVEERDDINEEEIMLSSQMLHMRQTEEADITAKRNGSLIDTYRYGSTTDKRQSSHMENIFSQGKSQADDDLVSIGTNDEDESTTVTDQNTARDSEDLTDD